MTVTRLTGGLAPGDGGDPRTFPAIWNDTADVIDGLREGFTFVETVYFTSSGTFTKADYPWLRAIRVRVQGAGGGGGGSTATASNTIAGGSGGGGGGYAESFITDIAGLDASVTVTRGAGGAGGNTAGTNGANGIASQFGSIVANGGAGGTGMSSASGALLSVGAGGDGGSASGGDLNINGGGGNTFMSFNLDRLVKGVGGASIFGGQHRQVVLSATRNGENGIVFGGGAEGSQTGTSSAGATGGSGANGIVIVDLYA